MEKRPPTYDQALSLLKEFNRDEGLLKHAYCVEGVMRYMARKAGEYEEKWGIVGLLHDLDYERFPEQHCIKAREILEERGWPEEYIRAILSHGWGICNDVEPQSKMANMPEVSREVDMILGLQPANGQPTDDTPVSTLGARDVRDLTWKNLMDAYTCTECGRCTSVCPANGTGKSYPRERS